jgi:PIN domain nuclease of toxin-antitoxin system
VSAATAWETATEKAGGRLEAPDDLPETLAANDSRTVSVDVPYAAAAGASPRITVNRSTVC